MAMLNQTQTLTLPMTGEAPNLEYGSIFFVGTATVILRYAGFTILTDPNFLHRGDHVHLGYGLTSERMTDPAIDFEQLPLIDFVLLSHMHEDHFDRMMEQKLDKTIPIITTAEAAADLRSKGFVAAWALNTWDSITITKGDASVRITAMPGTHAPGFLANMLPPVMGSMLEFQNKSGTTLFRLYISGDTLIHDKLKEIPRRFSHIDLALLHLGGTRIYGLMLTMNDKQGIEIINIVKPDLAIPIHYNDYTVFKSPLEDFMAAVREAGLEAKVRYLQHGETYTFQVPPQA
ncbi:MAG: MBL fold metallo-hydrolase [Anaerolineae bacterium]|nr:MBL fold metallo-hydrolase [Anaerolineae bacterium]